MKEMESFSLSEVESYCESEIESPGGSEIDPRVGVVFYPTHEETIEILVYKSSHPDYYLPAVAEANIYKYEPYELPGIGAIETHGKLYFFCELIPLDASGERFSRATRTGYWKKTGKKFTIKAKDTHEEIGCKRTLVFYKRLGDGIEERTNWVMQEYSANNNPQNLVICKIKEKKEKRKQEEKKDKKRCISTKNGDKRAKKRRIPTNDEGQSSHYVAFDNRNHFQGESSLESQQPPSCRLVSISAVHDRAEIISSEQQQLSSCSSICNPTIDAMDDISQVDTLPLKDQNALNGSTVLNQTSLSTQSPIFSEQGSSYSSVASNENDELNSSFSSDWDFLLPGDEFLLPDLHQNF